MKQTLKPPEFKTIRGPLAVVRVCPYCGHTERVEIGGRGRGYGFREGNKARGRLIQHMKHCSKAPKHT